MQTANSWTRDKAVGNNFLANGGTELNATTALYDLEYRTYDPALGRMYQVDPMSGKYSSLTTYNYAFNNPVSFNDPNGADPEEAAQFKALQALGSPAGVSNSFSNLFRGNNMFSGFDTGWRPGVGSLSASSFACADQFLESKRQEKAIAVALRRYLDAWGANFSLGDGFIVITPDMENPDGEVGGRVAIGLNSSVIAINSSDQAIQEGSCPECNQGKNLLDWLLDLLPGERYNGSEVLVSTGANIQLGVKRGASFTFNPHSEVLYQAEFSNRGKDIFEASATDGTVRVHREFGLDWGLGVNYKNVFETTSEVGSLNGMYKSDKNEVTVSYYGFAVKYIWGSEGKSLYYGPNIGAGIGLGLGGSAEIWHGNVIKF